MTIVNDSRKLEFEPVLTHKGYAVLNDYRRGIRKITKPHVVQATASIEGCCECGIPQAATVSLCGTCIGTGAYPLSPVYLDLYYPSYE